MSNFMNFYSESEALEIQPSQEYRQSYARVFLQKDIGFFQLPYRQELWDKSQELGAAFASRYKQMVLVGIGGSSLGPMAFYHAVGSKNQNELIFLDNPDSAHIEKQLQKIQWDNCAFVYISKSGGTLETLALASLLLSKQADLGIDYRHCSVVISETKENPLSVWAKENSLPLLEIPQDVGGRFSVLTAVGVLPAVFLGHTAEDMRAGALSALQDKDKVAYFCQLAVESFKRQEWISFFWIYSTQLKDFGLWIQQLWAESLAKKQTRAGQTAPRVSTPFAALGANDQHSLLQQVMDGARDKWVVFMRTQSAEKKSIAVGKNHFSVHPYLSKISLGEILAAEARGTESALKQQGISTLSLHIGELNAQTLGYLFMFFELAVAGIAEHLDIDAYDQPGVELGKRLATKILSS